MEILPIGICALGLGSLSPQAERTLLHLPSAALVKFESQVLIRINHWFIFHVMTDNPSPEPHRPLHLLTSPCLYGHTLLSARHASPHTTTTLPPFSPHPCLPAHIPSSPCSSSSPSGETSLTYLPTTHTLAPGSQKCSMVLPPIVFCADPTVALILAWLLFACRSASSLDGKPLR